MTDAAFLASLPTVEDPVAKLVRQGRGDLTAQRYSTPPGGNALDRFRLALRIDARDKGAKQGIADTARAYLNLGNKAATAGDLALARSHFEKAIEIATFAPPESKPVTDEVNHRRAALAGPFIDEAKRAAAAWDKEAAQAAYEKALAIDPKNAVAQEGLKKLPSIGSAGFVFRDRLDDGGSGPELVVLPGAKVAAGRYEVTRGEFRRWWTAAGAKVFGAKEPSCRDRESFFRSSKKRNWQNADVQQEDNHPVVCVSWDQAVAFTQWLSQRSGHTYRLLTNAEWDALSRDAKPASCSTANLADAAFNSTFEARSGAACEDGFAGTSPVGRYGAIANGLYDVDGNVREWVNSCQAGATSCREHRMRGRSWMSPPDKETVAFTDTVASDVASNNVGFRVARELGGR
ncbi:SUMF1/EgtB/PvdO family nonheme iron enzyme [Tahibacter amnicola]|uniref:SUMF1/EgtB/PvdO family nonheme iron enzyme n=2 Tax=Tahibacter amnicola TaxID=2976241 RepID=A0ABY6BQF1_9GAMM|nr:SUMF1/EgtB/PvdO family nonheme iron enzyme [Tahibacter amnicola]